jgi:hypothetical protein
MPTYYITLSIARPPYYDDAGLVHLLRQAADWASCVANEITTSGMVVEADDHALQLLEIAVRTKLAVRGGTLDRMTVARI